MDPNNPFAAGKEGALGGESPLGLTGHVNVADALRNGTMTALGNVLPIAGGLFSLIVVYFLSVCTCLGWMVTGPFMLYGMNRFMLSVVDGQPDFGALTSGLAGPEPMRVFLHGWAVILLLMLMLLPSMGVGVATQLAQQQGVLSPTLALAVTTLAGFAWSAVVAPLTYASYVWADRGLGPVESYTAAFQAFRPSWGSLVILVLLMQVAFFPPSLLGPYMQAQSEAMATLPPEQVLAGMSTILGLTGGLYLYMGLMGGLTMCWTITAYRQVVAPQASAA